jgi:nitrous oxidase accessory protein NosD
VSYTLRGRIESRLAAAGLPFLAACVLAASLESWWPLELAGAMVAVGLALDVVVYHRLLPYQPAWAALPLGAAELGATMLAVTRLGIEAPLEPALWFFAASWLVAQLLGHAGLPLLRLTYAEDGGELGRGGGALSVAAPAALLAVVGFAWVTEPPTMRLSGIVDGPLTIDRPLRVEGEPGTVVRGGIVIRSDDVVVRNVHVVARETGIDVDEAEDVLLEDVTVSGAELDGIHVRRSSVRILDCTIHASGEYTQGIDISFSFDRDPSLIEGCTVSGGLEGIVSHSTRVMIHENSVVGTSLRGITVTEMSMGKVTDNTVGDARGVGIFCGDYSHCEIEDNTVAGIAPDPDSDDGFRQGYGIQAHFYAVAELDDNRVTDSPRGVAAVANATIEHD